MMLRQLHLCFLLAILLLVCPKTGEAATIAYEEKVISVPANWQQELYNNDNTEKVTREITYTTGIKKRTSDTKTIKATHDVGVGVDASLSAGARLGPIRIGELFAIISFNFSYSYGHSSESVTMSEDEIYGSRSIKTIVTIPPRSTLTRWELIADVAGTKIGYHLNIDVLNDTHTTPHTTMSRVRVLVHRRINYGQTRIRIKHQNRNEYVTVIRRNNWPAATLGYSSRYLFILCQVSGGIRIKTLNTTHPDYEWAHSSSLGGWIHFEILDSGNSTADKQHWLISKEEPLHDGDVVTFKNNYYDAGAMCYYHDGTETNVYCLKGLEDRWVLEIVDAEDFELNKC